MRRLVAWLRGIRRQYHVYAAVRDEQDAARLPPGSHERLFLLRQAAKHRARLRSG